jgi:tetratricopeptide (TPR) repeat protein
MTLILQANQMYQQGNFKKAEALYRQLLHVNPQDINALWGLGKVALAFDGYQVAYEVFQKCIKLYTQEPALWLSLAQACQKLTRFDEAEQALINAYQLNSKHLPSLLALAIFYCEAGETDKAESHLVDILAIKSTHVQAFCLLVRLNRLTIASEPSQVMLRKLSALKAPLPLREKIALHYAFFTLYHQIKDYVQAFNHLKKANDLQSSAINFSVNDMKPFFSSLMTTFDQPTMSGVHSPINTESLVPIFIVGQPRSGSTLLEQMLIGHQDISSGGELPFLAGDIAQGIWQITGKHFPEGVGLLSQDHCKKLGEHYLKSVQSIAPKAKYIIDKMPANYQSIGLIKMLLPQAKIIHIKRNVMDVSWSIYQNNFEAPEPYFCSLTEISQYNDCYQGVMAHWYGLIPDFIHTIEYSNLVVNPETEITKVLAFCGLAYQSECLAFSNKKRHISTLSDIQLRSGIKQNQTEAWRPYQGYLKAIR